MREGGAGEGGGEKEEEELAHGMTHKFWGIPIEF